MSMPLICIGLDFSQTSFQNSWKKLPAEVQAEARIMLSNLIMQEQGHIPGKMHYHKNKNQKYKDVYTVHVTADDRYKASFKIENGIAVFRFIKLHDELDKNP